MESSDASTIAAWQFFGPSRVAEVQLGNGLVCTWMNNAGTNSAVQAGVPQSGLGQPVERPPGLRRRGPHDHQALPAGASSGSDATTTPRPSSASPRSTTAPATSSSSGRCTPRAAAISTSRSSTRSRKAATIRLTACGSTSAARSTAPAGSTMPAAARSTTRHRLAEHRHPADLSPRRPGQLAADGLHARGRLGADRGPPAQRPEPDHPASRTGRDDPLIEPDLRQATAT